MLEWKIVATINKGIKKRKVKEIKMKEVIQSKLRQIIREEVERLLEESPQLALDFGLGELEDILKKFMKLRPKEGKGRHGEKTYTYKHGSGWLTFMKKGTMWTAQFPDDRSHDFLSHLDKKGFGPNLFGTLRQLASEADLLGYTTVLYFYDDRRF